METTEQNDQDTKLNRVGRRIIEGLGSLLGIVCSAGVLYFHFTESDKDETWRQKVAAIFAVQFFIALFIFSVLNLIGAIAAPKKLEETTAKRALAALGFLLLWIIVGLVLGVD